MSDLIRREDVVKAMNEALAVGDISRAIANDILNNIPSAEPERKKGEWVDGLPYVNSHWWVCSICHVSAPENHTGYNFCPNCWSRMTRGE